MTPASQLERRYRRLLLVYPAAYRRSHGDELLTALLDAADAGRTRPGRRDVLDLVRGGLRQRLRLPIGPAPATVAVLAALVFGALGAGTGSFLGWCTVPPLRADAAATQVVSLAAGEPYLGGFSRDDRWQHRAANLHAVDPRYVPGWSSQAAAARFTAAGWTVEPDGAAAFIAAWGDVRARVSGAVPDGPSGSPVDVVLWLDPPAAVPAGTAAGWLAGAVGGWLLAAWTAYALLGSRSWGRRGAVAVLMSGSLLVLAVPVLHTYMLIGAGAFMGPDQWGPMPPVHAGFADDDAAYVPLLGLAAIAVGCVVAGARRSRPAVGQRPKRSFSK